MPKRKRGEPSLEENIAKWRLDLLRALKLVKGYERQRLSKRLREADPTKTARLEREVLVLKNLDLQQVAQVHLCSSLLRIKAVAESPDLPADIKPVPKPELSEEEMSALHNVTSALCNRKQVKDVIDEVIIGTCIALRVPMPEKKTKSKSKEKPTTGRSTARAVGTEEKVRDSEDLDSLADDESEDAEPKITESKSTNLKQAKSKKAESKDTEEPRAEKLQLLKRKVEIAEDEEDLESHTRSETSEGVAFEGFSDHEAEENMFSKYEELVGGSSDENESDEGLDDDDDESDRRDSKARFFQKLALDDISLSSEASYDSDDSDEALAPPSKKVKAVKPISFDAGNSAFLPSLMGGYISGSESASDVDVAPSMRKNRRGQRARQAIWEKKYGDKAKHFGKEKDSRNVGWDMKRGAVDDTSKPWKRGVANPFEKNHVHPDRLRHMKSEGDRQDRRYSRGQQDRNQSFQAEAPRPRPPPKRDDTGPLHPSWAAAKKAKEGVQKVEFKGKKVTFD
ncbi:Bud-site selection protein [Xylaria sp. FL1777]|nr:Bud-site selection protein [Xylaria sp. FL1777]